MKEIEQINTWLGQRMKNMSETRLFEIVIINFAKMEVALFMIFKEQALAQS